MKIIILAILLIAPFLVTSQKLVIDKLEMKGLEGQWIEKIYQSSSDTDVDDVAVFGWIQVDRVLSKYQHGPIFLVDSLPSNIEFNEIQNSEQLFSLNFTNYPSKSLTISSQNNQDKRTLFSLQFTDFDRWIFLYVAHSFSQQKLATYIKTADETKSIKIQENIKSRRSEYYKLSTGVGMKDNKYYFPGKMERLIFHLGENAFRDKDFEFLQSYNPEIPLDCGKGFSHCGFTGQVFDLCTTPGFIQMKSVLLGSKKIATSCLNYIGGKTEFKINESYDCITVDNFQELLEFNVISLVQNDIDKCLE